MKKCFTYLLVCHCFHKFVFNVSGTGDDVVDLENSTPAPAVATAKPKTKVVDENENTASLFLECEEEPLSAAQKNFHRFVEIDGNSPIMAIFFLGA